MLFETSHDLETFFETPLFSNCSSGERDILRSQIIIKEYRAGEVIVQEGADFPFLGVLTAGMVLAEQRFGRRGPRSLFLPMDMIGRPDKRKSDYDLRVVSESKICFLPLEAVKSYIERNPGSVVPFLSKTLSLVGNAREWIWIAYHREAFQRVCLFLCWITHTYRRAGLCPNDPPWKIPFSLTRAEIGVFLGMGLFTVSRHLNLLKEEGVISFAIGKSITILDPVGLYRLAQVKEEAVTNPALNALSFNDLLEF